MGNSNNQLIDLDLIERIRSGEEGARDSLVVKYTPMVKYIIKNYYSSFLDFEDLLQEGLIGLLAAIEEYKPEEFETKFSSFAYICILRRIFNVLKQTTGNKHRLLNEATSLQAPLGMDENRSVMDLLAVHLPQTDPELALEYQYIDQTIGQVLENHLSLLEYAVIVRLLKGYSAADIHAEMGIGLKVIDNARTRVKAKLTRLLEEHGSLLSPEVPTKVRKRRDLYLPL